MENKQLHDAVFIIDGSSFLYRAYYSVKPLTTPEGMPVQAVYGFCRMIKKLIDVYKPTHMLLVWDSKGKTVRHEMYEAYKYSRQAAPSDLIAQKELIMEFAQLVGLTQLHKEGIEADDLMFSIARQLEQEQSTSVLVTSDKDLGQVLSDKVILLDPFKNEIITKEILEQKLEFSLSKLPFYYALTGDASDSIPGVKGIGPKGAQQLVKQFASLQDLYAHLDVLTSERIRLLLQAGQDNAFLSEQLFRLRFYETYLTKQSCLFNQDNWQNAREFFESLGFKSMLKEAQSDREKAQETVQLAQKYSFECIAHIDQLNQLCNEILHKRSFALDTEGTSVRPLEGTMVGFSVCVEPGKAYYIPFGHKTDESQLNKEQVFSLFKPIFEDDTIFKYLHHAKFDALMFYHEGITLRGIVFDTIIAASLIIADGQRLGLKYLSDYYLQEPMLMWAHVVKRNKYQDFSYVPLALATEYAAADAHQTMRLYTLFEHELHIQGQATLFHELEMPLMHVLYHMEKTGILLDIEMLEKANKQVTQELMQLRIQIIDLIGPEFVDINLNSPKQLEELLFNYLKLPAMKKTTGKTAYSTDQEVLRNLAKIHPIPALIMRYRELFKLKSTYLDALAEFVSPTTGRVHTTFNQTAVSTGRLASSEPNLQNIPVDKFHIRAAFKAAEGYVFLSADYSQIELRVLAYLSQDKVLLDAFAQNTDIHALTASGLFDVPLELVSHEQRQIGKRINFSILYGLTAYSLAKDLEISHKTAKQYIERYMAQYPDVLAWMNTVIEKTKELGYTQTLGGRKRYLSGIYEKNKTLYDLARRVAINTVAQGTAAELTKKGMIDLHAYFAHENSQARILLQIHDELLLEVPAQEIFTIEQKVTSILQSIVNWNVPLVVTTRIGANWQEVTK